MKANLKTGKLEAFGREIKISSTVRNEINKLRTLTERLDAQDCSTKELFTALKNQRVNGEAAAAIDFMNKAKQESDDFLNNLLFEEKRIAK